MKEEHSVISLPKRAGLWLMAPALTASFFMNIT